MRIFLLILLLSTATAAQTGTFRWADESCRYSGVYNTSKITAAELKNTLKLSLPGSYDLGTNTTVWKYADIDRLDVAALDREYKLKSAELAGLNIAKSEYWEGFRKRKLRELEQVYKLERTIMLAFRDQHALLDYKDAPECMTRFGEPLIKGGESLLNTWRVLNEEERKKNVEPDRLRRIFEQQSKSPDEFKYALLEVMTFGWSNCANDMIPYIEYDGTPAAEFQKLFLSVHKLGCDEP